MFLGKRNDSCDNEIGIQNMHAHSLFWQHAHLYKCGVLSIYG